MLIAGSTSGASSDENSFPPRSGSVSLVAASGTKIARTSAAATAATFQPLPTTTPVPFPSHIQLEGATGPHAEDINGCYVLQATARGVLEKWKFCYFKSKCEDMVMCYGEEIPELGPDEGAGLVGWVVGKFGDPIDILARCVTPKEMSGMGFKWDIKSISSTFVPTYTMSAKPVVATAAAAAAAVCSQKEAASGSRSMRRNRERADSAAAHQRIAFASMMASAQAQLLAAQSGDGLLPAPPVNDSSAAVDELSGEQQLPELSRSITAPSKGRRISFAPTTADTTKPPAPPPALATSSRRLSADAPVFIPRRHTVVGDTLFAPPTTATKYGAATKRVYRRSGSTIDDLFRNVERQQGVFVNTRARKVTWNLGAVSDKLKSVVPGEGVSSLTFRLPRDDGELGPPIQLEFYPFGVKGKSPPGCVAIGLSCPQGACMRFTLSLGKVSSGKKVLMGNKFHVDFYPQPASGTSDGSAAAAPAGDSGIVQAFKYSELSVALHLIDWMDESY
ncbi:hypothetical protein FOZ63_015222 [Perkinsus olseni]|uniref:Uncharacterized protein n=1 Tax=Perkinsus olseni TaxID=32597 RepID=A0A7J6RS12_PEROL|nr:hypothetical protein FOZ63_015222 [Perkinsus olseni]